MYLLKIEQGSTVCITLLSGEVVVGKLVKQKKKYVILDKPIKMVSEKADRHLMFIRYNMLGELPLVEFSSKSITAIYKTAPFVEPFYVKALEYLEKFMTKNMEEEFQQYTSSIQNNLTKPAVSPLNADAIYKAIKEHFKLENAEILDDFPDDLIINKTKKKTVH